MKLAFAIVLLLAATSSAQVVQLPAVSSFGASTTISVPDQGTASLGGLGGSSSGSTSRGAGPLATTARGSQGRASSVSITATVIDLAAMDEAILNAPPGTKHVANFPQRAHNANKIVNTLTPHLYDITRPVPPPQPYDWMRALGPQGNDYLDSPESKIHDSSNVRYFMERAVEAQARGRSSAAQVYFRMALDRMSPAQLKRYEEIQAEKK